ncbi:MAG: hypothetical protein LBT23_03840 [Synergistaceae bacterium]|jgi:hypothetical protein|nr:hypothetical protein [Synergistaceae bacterium]
MKNIGNAKKVFAALVVIAALSLAGSAFARGDRHSGLEDGDGPGWHWDKSFDKRGGERDIELPSEIQDKRSEARRLMTELRAELEKRPVDRETAIALFRRHQALRNEISEWFFIERLDNISDVGGLN